MHIESDILAFERTWRNIHEYSRKVIHARVFEYLYGGLGCVGETRWIVHIEDGRITGEERGSQRLQ